MNENISMSRVVINVELMKDGEEDILKFDLVSESNPNGIEVRLNSTEGQKDLKNVFSALLQKMLLAPIELNYSVEENYSAGLYKDVCSEYIKAINSDIRRVYEDMKVELELFEPTPTA